MSIFKMNFCPVVLLAVLLVQCIDEPDVILGGEPVSATIRGMVDPCPSPTTVFLTENEHGDTIAVAQASVPNGDFVFREVPYGIYTLQAVREGWCTQQRIGLDEPISTVRLSRTDPKDFVSFPNPIEPGLITNDSQYHHYLNLKSYKVLNESVKIVPSSLQRNTEIRHRDGGHEIDLFMNVDTLFALDTFRLSFEYESQWGCDTGVVYFSEYLVPVDSAGLDSSLTALLVKKVGTYSVNTEGFLSQNSGPGTITMGSEDDLGIVFAPNVDIKTLANAVSTTPPLMVECFLYGDTLRIAPANPLHPDTTYHIIIGSDVPLFRTALRIPVKRRNETRSFFRKHWPLDGTENTPGSLPFQFESNYSLEPELLEQAFTIVPSVDSLRFVAPASGVVKVYHARLKPGTTYKIIVDETCRSRKGTILGETVTIDFTTESDS